MGDKSLSYKPERLGHNFWATLYQLRKTITIEICISSCDWKAKTPHCIRHYIQFNNAFVELYKGTNMKMFIESLIGKDIKKLQGWDNLSSALVGDRVLIGHLGIY